MDGALDKTKKESPKFKPDMIMTFSNDTNRVLFSDSGGKLWCFDFDDGEVFEVAVSEEDPE